MRNNWLLANDKTGFIKNTCLFTYVQCSYWLFKVQSHQHTPLLTFSSDAILLVCRSLPMPYSSDYSRSLLTTSLSRYAVYIMYLYMVWRVLFGWTSHLSFVMVRGHAPGTRVTAWTRTSVSSEWKVLPLSVAPGTLLRCSSSFVICCSGHPSVVVQPFVAVVQPSSRSLCV